MTGNAQLTPAPFAGAAFITDKEAGTYLGVCTRTIGYMVEAGKLRKVYPRPRAARLTVESVTAYQQAIEQGRTPPTWTQPGNPHQQQALPSETQKKLGLLSRWGIGGK